MNKKGQVAEFILYAMYTLLYILASPIISDVIADVLPSLSVVPAFFVKILLWFGLLMILMGGMKRVNNASDAGFF